MVSVCVMSWDTCGDRGGDTGLAASAGVVHSDRSDPFVCVICTSLESLLQREALLRDCEARCDPVNICEGNVGGISADRRNT